LAFEVRATRVEDLVAIEGATRGDLEGIGRWHFARQGAVSVVRCEWHVRSTRWWMNLIAPFARSTFIRNHARVMEQGGKSLARLLHSPLVSQETVDMQATAVPPRVAAGRWRERGSIDPAMVLVAGVGAGVIATVVQVALWWLAGMPLAETLFRDARLTAALVMGRGVLPPPSTPQWDILLVATLIHFALSFAYALIPAHLAGRLRTGPALITGGLYGLGIYAVNLYGFTLLFPWFAVARDWVTLVTHFVFGVVLAGGCLLFADGILKRRRQAARRWAMHAGTAAVETPGQADTVPEGRGNPVSSRRYRSARRLRPTPLEGDRPHSQNPLADPSGRACGVPLSRRVGTTPALLRGISDRISDRVPTRGFVFQPCVGGAADLSDILGQIRRGQRRAAIERRHGPCRKLCRTLLSDAGRAFFEVQRPGLIGLEQAGGRRPVNGLHVGERMSGWQGGTVRRAIHQHFQFVDGGQPPDHRRTIPIELSHRGQSLAPDSPVAV
jgi:hypothetical protein